MTPELEKYYEAMWDLFASQGWKFLVEDFKELEKQVDDIQKATDVQDLYFRKGQLDILNLILKRKETCEKVYEELLNETNV